MDILFHGNAGRQGQWHCFAPCMYVVIRSSFAPKPVCMTRSLPLFVQLVHCGAPCRLWGTVLSLSIFLPYAPVAWRSAMVFVIVSIPLLLRWDCVSYLLQICREHIEVVLEETHKIGEGAAGTIYKGRCEGLEQGAQNVMQLRRSAVRTHGRSMPPLLPYNVVH